MSQIEIIPLDKIDENPHRQLATYPTIETKIASLMRSFEDVGVWESIIARPVEGRYQLAFGHHRYEAAKRIGLTELPIIVRDLSDEDMLRFMGRENGEDYRTEFLIMLNTWEGGVHFVGDHRQKNQAIDIARILGWTAQRGDGAKAYPVMNDTARACASAHALIEGGYVSRDDLAGISVFAAKAIVERAHSRMESIQKTAEATRRPKKETEAAKKVVAKGAQITAREVKEGKIAQKDIRSNVDVNSYKAAAESKVRNSPLFAAFGHALSKSIEKMLRTDSTGQRLEEVAKAVSDVTMEEDRAVLRQLDYELTEVGIRADSWRKRLIPNSEKIVGLPALEKKDA